MFGAVEGSTSGEAVETPSGSGARGERLSAAENASTAMPRGRVPDFFIVGHQKCGTTALYLMLQHHPQIYMPAEKEPRFFIRELRPRPRKGKKPTRPSTVAEYLAMFADARPDQRAGEASP